MNAIDFSLNIEPEDPTKFNDTNFSPRKVLTQALHQSQSGSLLKSQEARVKEAILGRRHHSLFENTLSVIEKTLNTELEQNSSTNFGEKTSGIQQAKKPKKKKTVYLSQKKHVMAALAPKLDKEMVALSE